MISYLRLTCLVVSSALFVGVDSARAYAPMVAPRGPEYDIAELCQSTNGQVMIVQPFGATRATFVVYSSGLKRAPVVKYGFRYQKEMGGVVGIKEVSLDAFENMAKPLDPESVLRDRETWNRTFEYSFEGNVTVFDEQSNVVGNGRMNCHAAKVEYRFDNYFD